MSTKSVIGAAGGRVVRWWARKEGSVDELDVFADGVANGTKGYVWPQLVERMTHTLKAGRLLPRMPLLVHCIIAEYLVSMCEVRRSFPPLYHISPHVRHGRGIHEANDLRIQCRGS